jgi:hypothetical protein
LRCVDSEGLLAKDVLVGLEGKHSVREVVAVGSGNIDDLNIGVINQLGVRAVRLHENGPPTFLTNSSARSLKLDEDTATVS